jgi:hypothetical protein
MPLFTIILDHAGGTYTAQLTAHTAIQALKAWAKLAPALGIPGIGPAFPARALKDQVFLDPTPIENSRNVWCTGIGLRGSNAQINIIATVRAPTEMGVSSLERFLHGPPRRPRPGKTRQ